MEQHKFVSKLYSARELIELSNEAGGEEKDFFEVLVFRRKTKTSKPPYD
jgi:hypothetical protein